MTPELTAYWIKALGGTRFLLTVGNGLVCAGLLIGGWLTGSEFVTVALSTTAVFIAAESHVKIETKKVDGAQGI